MIKTVVTEAIISKGYEGADAIKIIQGEKGDIARFRIAQRCTIRKQMAIAVGSIFRSRLLTVSVSA